MHTQKEKRRGVLLRPFPFPFPFLLLLLVLCDKLPLFAAFFLSRGRRPKRGGKRRTVRGDYGDISIAAMAKAR